MTQTSKRSAPGPERVRTVIENLASSGIISLEMTAERLGTSPRTLQRRLSERGLSFWSIVEQSRFEIAGALLRETDLKVQEIAVRIGYCKPNAFSRAFFRWAGCSPTEYRKARAGSTLKGENGAKWAELARAGH
jgi:AraC-like DNA-binding protein